MTRSGYDGVRTQPSLGLSVSALITVDVRHKANALYFLPDLVRVTRTSDKGGGAGSVAFLEEPALL